MLIFHRNLRKESLLIMSLDYLFNLFPTAKHKRSFYPIRPIFTLFTSLFFLGLGVIGVLPMGWALWAFMLIGADDLFATPFIRVTQSVENLINHRKKYKAIVSLISIALGITIGLALALFVLPHMPMVIGLIQTALERSQGSIAINAICLAVGVGIARVYKKSPFLGMLGGGILALLSSSFITLPLAIECMVCITLATTFLSSLLAQYGLKIYYKIFHGDSNADGYSYDNEPSLKARAQELNVTPEEIRNLQALCRKGIKGVKKRGARSITALTDFRWQRSNSFKDIFHLLTKKEDKDCLLILLRGSQEALESKEEFLQRFKLILLMQNKEDTLEMFLEILELQDPKMIQKIISLLKGFPRGMFYLVEALKEHQKPIVKHIYILLAFENNLRELHDLLYTKQGVLALTTRHILSNSSEIKFKISSSVYTFFSLPQSADMDSLDLRLRFHKDGVRKAFKELNSKNDEHSISKEEYLAAIAPFFRHEEDYLASTRLKGYWEKLQREKEPCAETEFKC
jgi:hypothetical protein